MNTQRSIDSERSTDRREGAHIVSLASPAVARAVIAELLLRPDVLTQEVRSVLQAEGADKAMMAALDRIVIWADLSSVVMQGLHREERQWRDAALRYCVLRGAHYALLNRLFKVTRAEVARLREELMVNGKTRPVSIPDADVSSVHQAWVRIADEWRGREADRWVALAEQFPKYPLSSLYQLIVDEAQSGLGGGAVGASS